MSRTVISALVLAASLLGGAGLAAAQTPDASEWVSHPYLHVESDAARHAAGRSAIRGYVYNDNGQPAVNVDLEITELDSGGNAVGTVIRRVDEPVPAKGRAYFDVRVPDSASYRVAVRAADFVEGLAVTAASVSSRKTGQH